MNNMKCNSCHKVFICNDRKIDKQFIGDYWFCQVCFDKMIRPLDEQLDEYLKQQKEKSNVHGS